jgi:hypothetical protein
VDVPVLVVGEPAVGRDGEGVPEGHGLGHEVLGGPLDGDVPERDQSGSDMTSRVVGFSADLHPLLSVVQRCGPTLVDVRPVVRG